MKSPRFTLSLLGVLLAVVRVHPSLIPFMDGGLTGIVSAPGPIGPPVSGHDTVASPVPENWASDDQNVAGRSFTVTMAGATFTLPLEGLSLSGRNVMTLDVVPAEQRPSSSDTNLIAEAGILGYFGSEDAGLQLPSDTLLSDPVMLFEIFPVKILRDLILSKTGQPGSPSISFDGQIMSPSLDSPTE